MLPKRLMLAWSFFDTCLLAAGLVTLILSFVWRQPNLLLNLTFSSSDLTGKAFRSWSLDQPPYLSVGGTILGIFFLATFVSSLILVTIRGERPLVMLNWLLLANGIAILVAGTYIWVSTLHERNNYHQVFGMQSNATKIAVQDTVRSLMIFT